MAKPFDWDAYRTQASQAAQAVNTMPFVFGDYGSLGGLGNDQIKERFYPGTVAKPAEQKPIDQLAARDPVVARWLAENPKAALYYEAYPDELPALQDMLGTGYAQAVGNPLFSGSRE